MRPIKTARTTGVYGAPPGMEEEIGGLPYYRETVTFPTPGKPIEATEVYSVWTFSEGERKAIAKGANIILGIVGEPIRPVSLGLTDQQEVGDAS